MFKMWIGEKMKLSSIIFVLGLFSILSSVIGILIWEYIPFFWLSILGVLLNFLSTVLEDSEKC